MSDLVVPPSSVATTALRPSRLRETITAYVALTKPRVVELLLVTTVPVMVLADRGVPPLGLIAGVLLGGALAAGGANTINCWIERDRDQLMRRTCGRPIPSGRVEPARALAFGVTLEVVAFAVLVTTANLVSAALTLSAALFYVFVYTIWLKPRSDQNIVVGGAAGAVPCLVGWAAVTGGLAAPAWMAFALVFVWTPPHFWALALRYCDDYAAAGIPMLPVVRGARAAGRQIFAYSVVVTAVSLGLAAVAPVGALYLVTATVMGAALVAQAWRLARDTTPARAIRFFGFSNAYLAAIFSAIALDTIIRTA